MTLDATRVGRDAGRVAEEVIAHLTGLVNPSGQPTNFHFFYGPTDAYGSRTPAHAKLDTSAGSDTSDHTVGADIAGLNPGQTYHFRIGADNASVPPPAEVPG